jgi:hypothetical protein
MAEKWSAVLTGLFVRAKTSYVARNSSAGSATIAAKAGHQVFNMT